MNLPNGMGTFQVFEQPLLEDVLAAQQVKTLVIQLFGAGLSVELTLKKTAFLGKAADYIGRTLDVTYAHTQSHPFGLHLLLAFIAHHNRLPFEQDVELLRTLVGLQPVFVHDDWMATTALEREVAQSLAKTDQEAIWLPNGSWNLARSFLILGTRLWQLKGEQAAFWGTVSSHPESIKVSSEHRALFPLIAAIAVTPHLLKKLPLLPAPGADPSEIWLDAISLASGPGHPEADLRHQGLGAHGTSPLESGATHLGMIWDHAQALEEIARFILFGVQHPAPRYLGRLLRMPLPETIAPQIRQWGIDHFVFQVQENGLYISARDQTQRSLAAAWWKASPESAWRVPLSFPPAAWTLLHPVLSAFWGDLCSEIIIIQRADLPTPLASADLEKAQKQIPNKKILSSRIIYLPPVKIEDAQWTDESDIETIRKIVTRHWKGYRRLPGGWADRQERADFKRRQEAAAQRAASHFYAAPSPGYTFAAPKGSAAVTNGDQLPMQIPRVKARSLQSLSLGLSRELPVLHEEEQVDFDSSVSKE